MVPNRQTKALQLHYQDVFQNIGYTKAMVCSEFMRAFTESYIQDNSTHITTTKVCFNMTIMHLGQCTTAWIIEHGGVG